MDSSKDYTKGLFRTGIAEPDGLLAASVRRQAGAVPLEGPMATRSRVACSRSARVS
jgi:hypothetical protein